MLMSLADAATAQWAMTVPPDVSSVAFATADAFPVAFVSEVIAFAVAVPLDAEPNAVAENVNVAAAVPGDPADPDNRNFNLPGPDTSNLSTSRSQTSLRMAVVCVTLIVLPQDDELLVRRRPG